MAVLGQPLRNYQGQALSCYLTTQMITGGQVVEAGVVGTLLLAGLAAMVERVLFLSHHRSLLRLPRQSSQLAEQGQQELMVGQTMAEVGAEAEAQGISVCSPVRLLIMGQRLH